MRDSREMAIRTVWESCVEDRRLGEDGSAIAGMVVFSGVVAGLASWETAAMAGAAVAFFKAEEDMSFDAFLRLVTEREEILRGGGGS